MNEAIKEKGDVAFTVTIKDRYILNSNLDLDDPTLPPHPFYGMWCNDETASVGVRVEDGTYRVTFCEVGVDQPGGE